MLMFGRCSFVSHLVSCVTSQLTGSPVKNIELIGLFSLDGEQWPVKDDKWWCIDQWGTTIEE